LELLFPPGRIRNRKIYGLSRASCADGWTTIAVDRASRRCAVAQGRRQADTAREAYERLYEE
jgi:hypothetical protein